MRSSVRYDMTFETKFTVLSVLTAGIGLGSFFLVGRTLLRVVSRWRFLRVTSALIDDLKTRLHDPISKTTVVTDRSEWDRIHAVLVRHIKEVPILGFDCEWVSTNGKAEPIALIQLSSYRGECALIRVSHMPVLPQSLVELLCNPNLLKVGVATWEDSTKLRKDMNIHLQGGFDIRHLITRHEKQEILLAKSGLSGLSENLLGIKLNKKYNVRCSDWEADALTETQIKYAAQDAIASIAICMKLIADNQSIETKLSPFDDVHGIYNQWTGTAAPFADTKFRLTNRVSSAGPAKNQRNFSTSSKYRDDSQITAISASRAFAARKKPLYDNCILQAPDGQPLCTCDVKKALWYVSKERGVVVCENPMTIRLTFEPAGRPSSDYDQYYLLDKENMCVVCGRKDTFIRKNIVPHEYRKHFPLFLKDHKSHDILLLCLPCHTRSCLYDNDFKNQLAEECEAPIGTEKDVKQKLDHNLSGVQKAANALTLNRHVMPASRVVELEDKIKSYYQVDEITAEFMEKCRNLEIHVPNVHYVPHGKKVVSHYESNDGLLALERKWREHFLATMKPNHLPALWSVNHSRTLEDKWGEKK